MYKETVLNSYRHAAKRVAYFVSKSRRNGGYLVNNAYAGRAVIRITTVPEWHYFHIKETQFTFLNIIYNPVMFSMKKENITF